jgi:hypothetical protein
VGSDWWPGGGEEGGGGRADACVGDRLASVVMVWHPIIELGF